MNQAQATCETVYEHTSRPAWGHAIVAVRGNHSRTLQFEDGKVRTIHDRFGGYLQPVEHGHDRAQEIIRGLKAKLRTAGVLAPGVVVRANPNDLISSQVAAFRLVYHGGFNDPEYRSQVRGEGAPRPLKRHRAPAAALAATLLRRETVEQLFATDNFEQVFANFVRLMKKTTLAGAKEVSQLANVPLLDAEAFARGLGAVLYGEEEFDVRFDGWVKVLRDALGKKPGWQLTTAVLALVNPNEFVAVRETVFRKQAVALRMDIPKRPLPTAKLYSRYARVASTLVEELTRRGLTPNDLMDIHEFIWVTQRPASKELYEKLAA